MRRLATTLAATLSVAIAAGTTAVFANLDSQTNNTNSTTVIAEPISPLKEKIRFDRIEYARKHGCVNPEAIVDALEDSELADLLLSIAIEESHCDGTKVSPAGAKGPWQVLERWWGPLPEGDLKAQARQAERIVRDLSARTRNLEAMLAWYNGGVDPPGSSRRYAKRVLAHSEKLSASVQTTETTN